MTTLITRKFINLQLAKEMLSAAMDKAKATPEKPPVTVAIVDGAGGLVCLERTDGAPLITADIAYGKARTSALHGQPTSGFQQREPSFSTMTNTPSTNGFIFVEGGVPIFVDNQLVGGIGVAGRHAGEDVPVVEAAMAALARATSR